MHFGFFFFFTLISQWRFNWIIINILQRITYHHEPFELYWIILQQSGEPIKKDNFNVKHFDHKEKSFTKGLRLQTNKKEEVRVISIVDPLISPPPQPTFPRAF